MSVYMDALKIAVEQKQISMSTLQRKLGVGYIKAGKIMEWLEENGAVEPFLGKTSRMVLLTSDELLNNYEKFLEKEPKEETEPKIVATTKKPCAKKKKTETPPVEWEVTEDLIMEAARVCIKSNSASISMLQRKLCIGYNRAGALLEKLEELGYVSPFDGAKARDVLITKAEFEEKYGAL